MNDIDLRQIGTIFGLPLYIDVSSVPSGKSSNSELLTYRDEKVMLTRKVISDALGFDYKKDANQLPHEEKE